MSNKTSGIFRLGAPRFYHGNAVVEGRALLLCFFEDADAGVATLIPGVRGAMGVARFRLPSGLSDPRKD